MSATKAAAAPVRKPVPGWLIIVAVVLTIAVTVWIINKKNPDLWQAGASPTPMRVVQAASPILGAAEQFQVVAGVRELPVIQAGSRPGHEDRGPCTRCHSVVDTTGVPVAQLHSYAVLTHSLSDGLCINCHGALPPRATMSGNGALMAVATMGLKPPVADVEWMGMEAVPITRLTAEQYRIPPNIQGVVIAEVEGRARAAGLQAGDVVVAVDGAPVIDTQSFNSSTRNGRLDRGTVQVLRGGKFLEATFETAALAPAAAPHPPEVPEPPAVREPPERRDTPVRPAQLPPPAAPRFDPPVVQPAPLMPVRPNAQPPDRF